MALYVYAITGAGHPCRLEGLTGVGAQPGALRSVTADQLCAVVSDVDEEVRPKRRDLTAHQEVQTSLMADGAVLPLQFGYIAADEQTVREALLQRADLYLDSLERVDGCAEYNIKASQDEEALLREILAEFPDARKLNDRIREGDTDPRLPLQLGELVATEVRGRQEALASGLVQALVGFARDHAVRAPVDGDVLNLSLLVHGDRKDEFLDAAAGLAEQVDGVEFRIGGPLPPYSFV
ncbi:MULTISPECIES: GvpL/GvpF family gas vesicle protein [unclassified Streptomyces]|uniref:GvpL/GvpF family gas vesicle protein n=1 Tax=unclassified Streptomyces TaxID=2593676 RepID=UPI0004AA4D27|nr:MULTISPECIES: GvpL/GvpF family gas vesicle protein [unclassified Streptomyces]APU38946.1 gas vesicle protein [Streptomyces sp. TN58]KJK47918.1 gas vesicle protein [Streptomyces sp. NRRL F-4428]